MATTRTLPRAVSAPRRPRRQVVERRRWLPDSLRHFLGRRLAEALGVVAIVLAVAVAVALGSYHPADPAWNVAVSDLAPMNRLGTLGSYPADLLIQTLGAAAFLPAIVLLIWGSRLLLHLSLGQLWLRVMALVIAVPATAMAMAPFEAPMEWMLRPGLGGALGRVLTDQLGHSVMLAGGPLTYAWVALCGTIVGVGGALVAFGVTPQEWWRFLRTLWRGGRWSAIRGGRLSWQTGKAGLRGYLSLRAAMKDRHGVSRPAAGEDDGTEQRFSRRDPLFAGAAAPQRGQAEDEVEPTEAAPRSETAIPAAPRAEPQVAAKGPVVTPDHKRKRTAASDDDRQTSLALGAPDGDYVLPPLELLSLPGPDAAQATFDEDGLRHNAELLQGVLSDFGVRGEIVRVNPGPVVTLYELEPAPGTKSSRVIGLADDIARSMSAVSVRVAVVQGRNAIGIELPNRTREIVFLRELMAAESFERNAGKLALVLGKDIGGHPVFTDLARMPHLLVAGTTGSGKSVAINVMILSLLYRLSPDRVRFILIDPKMLELSVYDGIPHLLAPVVTDPKKAVVALKWTVREMEDRYRAMSKLGVRNIEGYNQRLREARRRGETLMRKVQTGFDPDTGKPVFEDEPLDLTELPYIVVVVDEMADLMLVAGKDIEAAIQRLAQMARAAGIHLIMATQRPSVDVVTGTIKANFPTRVSFQVTSKVDSRTILGEGGAETLLGMGDMLYMAGGGRITRVHGPFVSDDGGRGGGRLPAHPGRTDLQRSGAGRR